ncbi:ATP-binding protein [Streptomyces rubellomurinus]|uniref:Signal transduction histidine-protein kinase/phosphatase MprB n=2 Tax=Streptomyces TaxID=1883 RepID=A0A0F2TH73_STRR3|nr:ATP-binding protein [Streptomyces rubellomurinus]KJS55732.1 histidine kinase [Streptomyces rubellomurinus subsp. indigoferus]KJS62514.1 histidine kinase [Streptomyces rubellomurinus]
MKRRMINSLLGVVLVVVVVFCVPLALVEKRTIVNAARDRVDATAVRVLDLVEGRIGAKEPVNSRSFESQVTGGSYVEVQLPGLDVVSAGERPAGDHLLKAVERGSSSGVIVTVEQSREDVDHEIANMLLLLGVVALLAVQAAVALAVWQAKRLARPLTDLAEIAERLGSGDPRPRDRRYGVPELDRVAEVLDTSAERIARMLTAERRLAADASHQLRTPLTALSMRLEEITALAEDPETVREEATIALQQVERLTDVVQRLLTTQRDPRSPTAVAFDLDDVIKQQVEEWGPTLRERGRVLSLEGLRGITAVGTPGTVAQVLATLIENSLMHGAGTITVRVRPSGTSAVVEVQDQGPGVPADLGNRVFERAVSGRNSTGIGLAVARDLAEADGGRLELLSLRPPVFALFLGRSHED